MIDWDGIVQRDGPGTWQAAWRILGNRADVDDVFQEAFVDAFTYSQGRTIANWRALLQRLATTRAIDRLRQRIRRRGREEPLVDRLVATDLAPPQVAQEAELSAQLRMALVEINSKHAEVFCLFHLEGWTYQQIAEHLAVSTDVVGVWLNRARGKLRELMRDMSEGSS